MYGGWREMDGAASSWEEGAVFSAASVGREDSAEALRPAALDDYIGQREVVSNLRVFLAAARRRGEPLDHVLFYGPPGLGKTTLAHIIAREMGAELVATSGPVLERPGDLAAILSGLQEGDVLFIDEIHRIPRPVEEILYGAMEQFTLDIVLGKGPGARTFRLDLPRFTLVGATTRLGLLGAPLRDRFGVLFRLDYYAEDELAHIVLRAASRLGVEVREEAAAEIARRARGTPRIALRLLRRVRDFAEVEGDGRISHAVACRALDRLRVDPAGLDPLDRRFLLTLIDVFGGGPAGLDALAAALGEDKGTLEEVYEPYLLGRGFLARTPRGRVALPRAYAHLGRPLPGEREGVRG
ncbi:MAG: Holliday junction DNA helicase RuvB [Brockia lithotrophica]|uniref:Holliday junction branch migration complex subunit RuvB n=1 Tax=Brockia lithotrophica TaxID=933949 RepID=A0A2T5G780_9BACL|nr:MAG: Holliday junction DNA helicase RuvB [Brockia lithotrophica]